MKRHIENLLQVALKQLQESGKLPAIPAHIEVDATKNKQHGDFASNIAMILARVAERSATEVAALIVSALSVSPYIEKVEIAGPGFINFFLSQQALNDVVATVIAEKEAYGRCKMGRGKRILFEFLSSVPNGPLHVGQGRQAVIGVVVANLLDAVGFKTYRECYLNDHSAQLAIFADIHDELSDFGVCFDNKCSGRQLMAAGSMTKMLEKLQAGNHLYPKDGALFFRSVPLGDEKDRILMRANGEYTYFAYDVAYHLNKFERGFDIAIDMIAANQHSYFLGLKAAMEACGINPERLIQLLVHAVTLSAHDKHTRQRSGEFVSLHELRNEISDDSTRFFYAMRKTEQQLELDVDLALRQSNENPAVYVQSAYTLTCQVMQQLAAQSIAFDEASGIAHASLLIAPFERQILNTLSRYPDMIIQAALQYEPHLLIAYLRDLAADFHAYYHRYHFLVSDSDLQNARLALVVATQQTLINGFNLLGLTAAESIEINEKASR